MKTSTYQITMTGASPLLMHSDNPRGGERVKAWTKNPNNKKLSVAGDDRSPAFTWLTYVYHNDTSVCMDVDNVMAMLRDAGQKCPNPNGRGSLKTQTQSGFVAEGLGWELTVNGKNIPWKPLNELFDEPDFEVHEAMAQTLGFQLFMKRATIGQNKHIRIRPRFDNWKITGKLLVLDESLNKSIVETIFQQAGFYVGIGDWRPGSRTPGQFGRFEAMVEKLK